ncbi:MAG: hypothetical protein HN348_36815, partial [Proteobacteria bacterium]|nr:hypothetical protein [Pseudomonadota bacterium]
KHTRQDSNAAVRYDHLTQMAWKEGTLPPHFEVFAGIRGRGSDLAAVQNALKGKSPAEIDSIALDFAKTFGDQVFMGTETIKNGKLLVKYKEPKENTPEAKAKAARDFLEGALESDFSGRTLHRMKMDLKGDPEKVFDPSQKPIDKEAAEQRVEVEQARLKEDFTFEKQKSKRETAQAMRDAHGDVQILLDDPKFSQRLKDGEAAAWEKFTKARENYQTAVDVNVAFREGRAKDVKKVIGILAIGALLGTTAIGAAGVLAKVAIAGGSGLSKMVADQIILGRGQTDEQFARAALSLVMDTGLTAATGGIKDDYLKLLAAGGKGAMKSGSSEMAKG